MKNLPNYVFSKIQFNFSMTVCVIDFSFFLFTFLNCLLGLSIEQTIEKSTNKIGKCWWFFFSVHLLCTSELKLISEFKKIKRFRTEWTRCLHSWIVNGSNWNWNKNLQKEIKRHALSLNSRLISKGNRNF